MTVTIDGTTGVSAVQAGAIDVADLPTGSVLQVVGNTMTGRTQTTSTSFTPTQVTASITPTSASSKIIILMKSAVSTEAATRSMYVTLYRGATNLGDSTSGMNQFLSQDSGGLLRTGVHISYLDSPNTTSEVTYTLYVRASGSYNVEVPPATSTVQSAILMEIAG